MDTSSLQKLCPPGHEVTQEQVFGIRLKFARTQQELTQYTLAKRLGISQKLVSLWELGSSVPSCFEYRQLIKELGLEAWALLPDEDA